MLIKGHGDIFVERYLVFILKKNKFISRIYCLDSIKHAVFGCIWEEEWGGLQAKV